MPGCRAQRCRVQGYEEEMQRAGIQRAEGAWEEERVVLRGRWAWRQERVVRMGQVGRGRGRGREETSM